MGVIDNRREEKIMSMSSETKLWVFGLGALFAVGVLVLVLMFGLPIYNVWQQGLSGEAKLAKASQERQILIEQAKAEKESASIRAEAIAIVGKAAKQYPEYRLQEFLGAFAEALQSDKIEKIIYVPTEANIPIMEAGRLRED
jgi:hypothetical protein